ncbi:MAG: tRNA(Ile)-lysidine synthetase, partial [Lachnospiraceae bacterium]|nr:tRNA(Ile)-lysidine synthetase [Lachnospiraceae bacterium]
MINKVLKYVKKYRMIEPGDTIVAGVSGGADSVCLLFALREIEKEIPLSLKVVHVN